MSNFSTGEEIINFPLLYVKIMNMMKRALFILATYILILNTLASQSLRLGLDLGASISSSNYYDLRIDPPKIFYNTRPTVGLNAEYFYGKINKLYLATGVSIFQSSNAFRLEGVPYFPANQGFEKVSKNYMTVKVPFRVGYTHFVKNKWELTAFVGATGLFFNRKSLNKFFAQDLELEPVIVEAAGNVPYTLDYVYGVRTIRDQAIALEAGFKLVYPLNDKFLLSFSLIQQLGITPILGSILDYEIVVGADEFRFIGDAYVTSKGDALISILGISYQF